jgi:hypothetical protein
MSAPIQRWRELIEHSSQVSGNSCSRERLAPPGFPMLQSCSSPPANGCFLCQKEALPVQVFLAEMHWVFRGSAAGMEVPTEGC